MIIKRNIYLYSKSLDTLTPEPETAPPGASTLLRGVATEAPEVSQSKIYSHRSGSGHRGGLYNLINMQHEAMSMPLHGVAQHPNNHVQAYMGVGVIGAFLLAAVGCVMFKHCKRLLRHDTRDDNPSRRRRRTQDDSAITPSTSPVRPRGQGQSYNDENQNERAPPSEISVQRSLDDQSDSSETSGNGRDELIRLTAMNSVGEPVHYRIHPVQPRGENSWWTDQDVFSTISEDDVAESFRRKKSSTPELKCSSECKESRNIFVENDSAVEVDHVGLKNLPDITAECSSGIHTGSHEDGTDRYVDSGREHYAYYTKIDNDIINEDSTTNLDESPLIDEASNVSEYLASLVLDFCSEKMDSVPDDMVSKQDENESGTCESDNEESFSRLQAVKAQADYSPYHLAWTTPAGRGHPCHLITAAPHLHVKKKLCLDKEACKAHRGAELCTTDHHDPSDLESPPQGHHSGRDSTGPTRPLPQDSFESTGGASESNATTNTTATTTFESSFLREKGLLKPEGIWDPSKTDDHRNPRPLSSDSVLRRRSLVSVWLETGEMSADDTVLTRRPSLDRQSLPKLPYSVEEYRRSLKITDSPGNTAAVPGACVALDSPRKLLRESDCPLSYSLPLLSTCSASATSWKESSPSHSDQDEENNKDGKDRNDECQSPEPPKTSVNRRLVSLNITPFYTQEDVNHTICKNTSSDAIVPSFNAYLVQPHAANEQTQDTLNNNNNNLNMVSALSSPPLPSDASSDPHSTPSQYSCTGSDMTSSTEKSGDVSSVSMLSKDSDTVSPSIAGETGKAVAGYWQHSDTTTGFRPRITAEGKAGQTEHDLRSSTFTIEDRQSEETESRSATRLVHKDSILTSEDHEPAAAPIESSSSLKHQTSPNADCFKAPYPVDNLKRTINKAKTSILPRSRSTTSDALSQHLLPEPKHTPLRRTRTSDWGRKSTTQELMSVGSSFSDVSVGESSASRLSLLWDNEFTAFARGPNESLTWEDDPFL